MSVLLTSAITLIATVVGAFLPLFVRRLEQRVYGPKLGCKANVCEADTGNGATIAAYAKVRVWNSKPRIARKCQAYLRKVEGMQGNKVVSTVCDVSLPFIWEYDNGRESFDIARGHEPAFDVAEFIKGQRLFSVRLRKSNGQLWEAHSFSSSFSVPGRYRFSVVITAEDTDPLLYRFDVECDGATWPPRVHSVERA